LVTINIIDLTMFCNFQKPYYDELSFKAILLPNADPELQRVIQQVIGTDVTAMAFQVVPGSATDIRGYICGKTPIAMGTAKLMRRDNDVFGLVQDNPNVKAFGYKANGTLEGPEGQKYLLNIVVHIVVDEGDIANAKEYIKIQLTPTGGN
jgi:hypothetical protein